MPCSYSCWTLIIFLGIYIVEICNGDCSNGRDICEWIPWKSWSECSLSCGGGTRNRNRDLCCKSELSWDACVKDCGLRDSDGSQSESCNTFCHNGGHYDGGRCRCPDKYYSFCCSEEICNGDCSNGRDICEWIPWKSWSECSLSCGGGTRNRNRDLCCKSELSWDACVKDCGLRDSDGSQSESCNTFCHNGGHYDGGRCRCPDKYYSFCCSEECPGIQHCVQQKCDYVWDVVCKKCEDQGATKTYSIYWPSSDQRHCLPTCSGMQQWCWPGTCSDSMVSSCKCEVGFKKDPNSAICDIETKADLVMCKLIVQDDNGEERQTKSGESSTGCDEEADVFINIKPVTLTYHITANFKREGMTPENHYVHDTKIGIVDGTVSLKKENVSGRETSLGKVVLRGGGDCGSILSSTSPDSYMQCKNNVSFTEEISNGERFCANVDVSSGGSFKYSDFNGKYKGLKSFTPVVNKKVLCFKYDDVPPVHCSESNTCETYPLQLSSRVTKSGNVTVTVTGWTDPIPDHGTKAQASGIDYFKINIYGVKHLDPKTLETDYSTPVYSSENLEGDLNITINLTGQPRMYVIYLETHDVAGNVRFSRRFLLYDNESKLEKNDNKSFYTVSASKDTNYRWQIHHGNISLDWKDRYYNDFFIHNDYFVPIKADTGNSIVGVYEQLTGVLPVNGTESVNGVTGFFYQWSRNNGTKTRWMNVPNFTKQKMSLNLPLKDGETYEVWIKAQDIMVNTIVESVIIHIDRSVADMAYTGFVREGTNEIDVHNDTDLSKMVLQFQAFDVHSGITSVQWSLGTANAASDIGTGALPVIKLDGEVTCRSNINCYCPDVGPCEYQNYTLTLNSLVASNRGQSNGEYHITLCVTNGAMLKSFDYLVVLVNDSRPVVGPIEAGTTGSGLYIGTGLGVVLLIGLVTAVLVILKRKKKICYSKHQEDVVRYNAAPENSTYDSITREGDQAQQYETLGSRALPPAPGNKTYETLTRENDQTKPYMSMRFVVKADATDNPAYETVTPENDQAQLYMNLGCLGQAAKPKNST